MSILSKLTKINTIIYYILRFGYRDDISHVLEIKINGKSEYLAYHFSVNKEGKTLFPFLFIVKTDKKVYHLQNESELLIDDIISYLTKNY